MNLPHNSPSRLSISLIVGSLSRDISCSSINDEMKELYRRKLTIIIDDGSVLEVLSMYDDKTTATDLKYIICFFIGMSARDISRLFNIETNSVYTVRYRIRKKLKDDPNFNLIPF